MVSSNRAKRIADRIREELSEMLIFDIKDPRLASATFTDVSVDRELAYADIYVSSIQGSESAQDIIAACENAKGYLRSKLSNRIELRTFPQLRFHWDPTLERAEHIEKLLANLSTEEESDLGDDHPEKE